jgi:hypothetical protein
VEGRREVTKKCGRYKSSDALYQTSVRQAAAFLWAQIHCFVTRTSTEGFCFTAGFVEGLIERDKCCHLQDELRKPRGH